MSNLGFVTLQSNDYADVFYHRGLDYADEVQSDETMIGVEDPQLESNRPWVVGSLPESTPVNIDGDAGVIHGWFMGESYTEPFVIRVYVEYELAEELVSVDPLVTAAEIESEEEILNI